MTLNYQKDRMEDMGNYRSCQHDLSAQEGCGTDQLECNHTDNQGIRLSQPGVRKVRSSVTNTVSFYDKVICLVHKGKAVDIVFLDLSKGFYSVSHSILPGNLAAHGLVMCVVCRIKNCLDG